jgi:hypothetical protein
MLKIFSKHAFRCYCRPLLNNNHGFNFTGAVKLLRESDELSLSDFDSILGNEPSQLQKKKGE